MGIRSLSSASMVSGSKRSLFFDPLSLNGFYYIATVNGTGTSTTLTFSNIPTGFKHLEIRGIAKCTGSATDSSDLKIRFNGDSTSGNYSWRRAQAYSTSTLTENGSLSDSGMHLLFAHDGAATPTSQSYSAAIIKITDYQNTNKRKVAQGISMSIKASATSYGSISGGTWNNSAAITSISIFNTASNFNGGTIFELYGVK